MQEFRMRRGRGAAIVLAVVAGLLPASAAWAGSSEQWPLNWPWMKRPSFYGYDEKPPAAPPPAQVTRPPMKYTLTITVAPQMNEGMQANPNIAVVMAHVPENASLFIDDKPTRSQGVLREYESPPLQPGKKYVYHIRLDWFEDGQWVSETKEVPVTPGEMSCVYLTKPSAMAMALAELTPQDRILAEKQRFCPIMPETPLGAMGPPTKVIIKGQPVFLCCPDCVAKARKHPDQTLAEVKELLAKNAETPQR
jgi:uncharacterized protein (TIGR03000 family)